MASYQWRKPVANKGVITLSNLSSMQITASLTSWMTLLFFWVTDRVPLPFEATKSSRLDILPEDAGDCAAVGAVATLLGGSWAVVMMITGETLCDGQKGL